MGYDEQPEPSKVGGNVKFLRHVSLLYFVLV